MAILTQPMVGLLLEGVQKCQRAPPQYTESLGAWKLANMTLSIIPLFIDMARALVSPSFALGAVHYKQTFYQEIKYFRCISGILIRAKQQATKLEATGESSRSLLTEIQLDFSCKADLNHGKHCYPLLLRRDLGRKPLFQKVVKLDQVGSGWSCLVNVFHAMGSVPYLQVSAIVRLKDSLLSSLTGCC